MATLEQIEAALRAADAAGNVEDARRLAQAYAQARQQAPDFSNVQAGSSTTERNPANASPVARLISGQTPPSRPSLFRLDSDFRERSGAGVLPMLGATVQDMFGFQDKAAETLAKSGGGVVVRDERGEPAVQLPSGEVYRMNDPGLDSTDVSKVVGNAAAFLTPAGWAARAGQARNLGLVGRAGLQAAAAGGTDAAIQAGINGGDIDASRVGLAAAGGAGGEAVGSVLAATGKAAAAKITPELRALYDRAKAAGINLTPAQLSNSEFMKRVTAQLGKLPFAGGRAVVERQQAAGNREIGRLIGQETDSVTPRVLGDAADKIGETFDKVFYGGMKYDRQFLKELALLKQEAVGLDDTANNALSALVNRVQSQAKDGAISGRTLQSIDQQARRWASGGGDRQHVAGAFREALHEAFGRQAPAGVKQAWDTARRQWATLKTLEPVVARNTEGGIPLQALEGAINTTKAGRTARSRGRDGDLGELANVGQRVKAPTSSGTNENWWASQALNPLAWPLLGLGSVGGMATRATLNNAGLSGLLMREGRGQARQVIAPYVSRIGGLASQFAPKPSAAESKQKKP